MPGVLARETNVELGGTVCPIESCSSSALYGDGHLLERHLGLPYLVAGQEIRCPLAASWVAA